MARAKKTPVEAAASGALPQRKDLPSILIIDDEEPCRYILSRLLLDSSCTVLEAEDGSEGIRLCQTMKPDLIFLDLNMPGLSGWDVITEIATLPDVRQVPIVVVTAQRLSDESRSSLVRSTHSILMKNELSEETIRRVVNETVFARRIEVRSEVSS